ncbi:MAG: hypothetical protein OXU77_12495 [Gammaproteobacteria bacterium]|nr:hypothetical protein [Gammaproteobacteria bacterium]MDE0442445.1 hypothetical protein [Gammaproteobacteria bacterium]
MNPAVIDTLKFADRLKNAGFPPPQAEGLARALGEEMGERMVVKRDLDDAVQATKRDLDDAVHAINATIETLDAKFEAMDQKFESRFEAMDQKFETKFEAMDQKFEARFDAVDRKFEAMDQKFEAKFLALEPRFDAIDVRLESQHRETSTRFNVLFGTMALGFTLVIGLIGYSLFTPRPAGPPSPAVEHGVADATAWRSSGLGELS